MKIGIHKDSYDPLASYLKKYEELLICNNIDYIWLDIDDMNFWESLKTVDHFIYRWRHYDDDRMIAQTILPIIENELKINVFPNQNTCWHFDDKIRQYYLLKNKNYPITDCYIFWNKKRALNWLVKAKFPIVFKLSGGAGSSNVVKVDSYRVGKKLIKKMFGSGIVSGNLPVKDTIKSVDFEFKRFLKDNVKKLIRVVKRQDSSVFWKRDKNYVLFQKFLPNNSFDTRITIIGQRAFGFRRMMRDGDFRASGSGNIDHNPDKIDLRCVEIAFKVSESLGFQSMAYDFLYNEKKEPEICEISYTYQDLAVYQCDGYWDMDMNWHEGHLWPQYCHLVDLLKLKNLKQSCE